MTETVLTLSMSEAKELAGILEKVGSQREDGTMYQPVRNRREFAMVSSQALNGKIAAAGPGGTIELPLNEETVPHLNRALADTKALGGEVTLAALNYREMIGNAMKEAWRDTPTTAGNRNLPGGYSLGKFTDADGVEKEAFMFTP